MAEPMDFELMAQIQARERRAHFMLKDRYHKRLLEIAFAILRNPHHAEEVVRQVFEFSWRQAEVFDLERDPSVAIWLYELTRLFAQERLNRWGWFKKSRPSSLPSQSADKTPWSWSLKLFVLGLAAYGLVITWQYWQIRQTWLTYIDQAAQEVQRLYQSWIRQPNVQEVLLRDPSLRTDRLAQGLWSSQARRLILFSNNLAAAPPGQAYHVWVEDNAASPQPGIPSKTVEFAGSLTFAQDGTLQWASPALQTAQPDRLVITLESVNHQDLPTGEVVLESRLPALSAQPTSP
ncbi:MAG: RNA polymerase subunit sigma-70 [Cyanobacteriota bacterium]|nr:RNA polymerase subunit sigma-70 [Cyanobacteriota bacterium]